MLRRLLPDTARRLDSLAAADAAAAAANEEADADEPGEVDIKRLFSRWRRLAIQASNCIWRYFSVFIASEAMAATTHVMCWVEKRIGDRSNPVE